MFLNTWLIAFLRKVTFLGHRKNGSHSYFPHHISNLVPRMSSWLPKGMYLIWDPLGLPAFVLSWLCHVKPYWAFNPATLSQILSSWSNTWLRAIHPHKSVETWVPTMALTLGKTFVLLGAGFLLHKLKGLNQKTSKMSFGSIVCAVIGNTRDCQLQFTVCLLEGRNHSIPCTATESWFQHPLLPKNK